MHEYLFAFNLLSGRRQCGMALNPITFEAIDRYIDRFGASDDEEFILMMCDMDETFLTETALKKPKKPDETQE